MTIPTENKTYTTEYGRIEATAEFIASNNLTLNRSMDDVLQRIESSKGMFGFGSEVLVNFLPFKEASQFLKDEFCDAVARGDEHWLPMTDVVEVTQDFLDYMCFAWSKALDERGLSASRSIEKLSTWAWLLGRDDIRRTLQDDDLYNPYGAPALIEASRMLGIEVPEDVQAFAENKVAY